MFWYTNNDLDSDRANSKGIFNFKTESLESVEW